ncbi:hypothetical protein [Wolbachia endosymbiont (group A) of Philonthus cognatus]|uniref:hypothetical protein n=1 Tax=Wolbachia endosymbiont (group A) of Philonthus cognatus TaxID=2954046 RepID=UPI00222FD06B|nr:hypothetical protein [Wolbachia endosymbiont (group A) of Philonthus cognatus]
MELKIRKFPCPKKLPENVLSIDLGKSVGFAYVKDNTLYCGSYVLNVEKWRFNPPTLRQISSEYKGIIDALLYENKGINLVLLEDNSYFFKQRYIRGSHMSYYKKLQIMAESLFCVHWQGEVKRYFGGSLKKKHFGTARKEIVKERIKKMLDVSGMNDHMTDGIAGLFASLKREE